MTYSLSFTAVLANKELTHVGHKLANITDAIDQMKSQKPMPLSRRRADYVCAPESEP